MPCGFGLLFTLAVCVALRGGQVKAAAVVFKFKVVADIAVDDRLVHLRHQWVDLCEIIITQKGGN